MAYMHKEARRAAILKAAVDLIRKDGLAATTVRSVAKAIGASPGQIHHHFASADELRAEAFRALWISAIPCFEARIANLDAREKLRHLLLGDDTKEGRVVKRVWREALAIADRDEAVAQVIREGLQRWSAEISQAIQEARAAKPADPTAVAPELAAKRLIALSFGVKLLNDLQISDADDRISILEWAIARAVGDETCPDDECRTRRSP